MSMVRGVLLDVDGTLVDSNDAHARAWVKAFEESGIHASFGEVRQLIGKGGDKVIAELTGWDDESPRARKLSDRRREIFKEVLPSLRGVSQGEGVASPDAWGRIAACGRELGDGRGAW